MPAEVARIGKTFMTDPVEATVGTKKQVQQQYLAT
jgi:hypothetical protein